MTKQSKKQNLGSMGSAEGLNRNGKSDLSAMKVADQPGRVPTSKSADTESKEDISATAMSVPDPDFHDFDLDR
ncbi:hypothetical protein PSY31_22800, partial [Shigella flexneri]|nr:hypothetical protein [Shigella flexneri]